MPNKPTTKHHDPIDSEDYHKETENEKLMNKLIKIKLDLLDKHDYFDFNTDTNDDRECCLRKCEGWDGKSDRCDCGAYTIEWILKDDKSDVYPYATRYHLRRYHY